jgi:ATP-dependent exoDNAse (exonuclease V) beta subunit
MRKDSFDLRQYWRRSLWKRVGSKEHGERLADRAEEHYARCHEAYSTFMGRIATAIISVFSAEVDRILAEYEAFKQRAAVMDFDDLLFTCRDVLRAYPQVRTAAAERISRILVDEFQDTDPVQAEIIFLLSTTLDDAETWYKRRLRAGHLFLVGDPKQAIYRFRGAEVTIHLTPGTRVDRSRDEEARVVAEICGRLIGNVELKLNDGTSRRLAPGDIALLAPVSTDLWRYERALEETGLPFASQAGKNLFRRQEAQDLVALVRTLADSRDTLALGAFLRGPLIGLTEQ